MNTTFLLMARYDGKPVIPVADVCRDFFTHLKPEKFVRKVLAGEISIPLVRIENSKRAAHGVALSDLAAYLDKQIEEARRDCEKLGN